MVELKSELLRRLYDDWELRRGGRRFPARRDFDPLELKYVLGNLSLIDVLRDSRDYRYRLCGSISAARYGIDLTGRRLSEFLDIELRDVVRSHLDEVLRREAPVARFYDRTPIGDRIIHSEVLALPLSHDAATIDMVMTAGAHF